MMIKKVLPAIAALSLMAALLAACAGAGTPAGGSGGGASASADTSASTVPAEEQITLRISWWGNQLRNDTTLAWLDFYSEENPNVVFEAEFTDWSGYWDRLATQAAAGNLPDIIQQDLAFITQYWARGLLANLSDLSNRGYLDLSEVPESIIAAGSFEGDLYALTIGVNARTISYRTDLMEEAGISWSERPTFQEIMDHSSRIFEVTGLRSDTPSGIGALVMIARNVGETAYGVDADGNNIIGASPETVLRSFRYVYETINAPWSLTVEQRQDNIGVGLEAEHLPAGRAWLGFPNSNQLAAIQAATEAPLGITFFPVIESGLTNESMYLRSSMFFSVTTTSQHQEEAARVIDHFTNNEDAQLLLMAERGVPVNPRMAEFLRPHLDPVQQDVFAYIAKVTEIAMTADPPHPNGAAEVNRLFDDLIDMVRFGMITPEEAAERFIPEANAVLAVHQDD